jgi:hypothetical protein
MRQGDLEYVLQDCDSPSPHGISNGFWRVDQDIDPELRRTILTLLALHDLEKAILECAGDLEKGIEAFLAQNNNEGWMIPEILRLSDYGFGHDDRAKQLQPVANRLGPRFYDWQLVQFSEESWRECNLHARNLLGERGYIELLEETKKRSDKAAYLSKEEQALVQDSMVAEKMGPLYSAKQTIKDR